MKNKLIPLLLIAALLMQFAGCGGAPAGLAADVQGTWVGELPGDDGTTITEWGFSGRNYHILSHEEDSEEGNLETGTFAAGDDGLSLKGKVEPFPKDAAVEPYYTDYTVICGIDGDELRVEYEDTEITLHREKHSDLCPACKEKSDGWWIFFPFRRSGGTIEKDEESSSSSQSSSSSSSSSSLSSSIPPTPPQPPGSDVPPDITSSSSSLSSSLSETSNTPPSDPGRLVPGGYEPPLPWNDGDILIGDAIGNPDPKYGYTLVMEGKSRINTVNIVDESAFRASLLEDAKAGGADMSDPYFQQIVNNDIELAVKNVNSGVMSTRQIRDIHMEINYNPNTEAFSVKMTLEDAELIRVADYLQLYANSNEFTFRYNSIAEMNEKVVYNQVTDTLHFNYTDPLGSELALSLQLYVNEGGFKTADGNIDITSASEGMHIFENFKLTLVSYEKDDGTAEFGYLPPDTLVPEEIVPKVT